MNAPLRVRLMALSLTALLAVGLIAAGCGQKEDPAPKGTSYYTGPMEKKGGGQGGAEGGKMSLPKTE